MTKKEQAALDQHLITRIRGEHLKANIDVYEGNPAASILWHRAVVDQGGTIFGPGPYLKVPVVVDDEMVVVRVYPTARLRPRLLRRIAYGDRRRFGHLRRADMQWMHEAVSLRG